MSCGSCGKRRNTNVDSNAIYQVLGGHKYLPDRQLKARLEVFKKRHCKNCEERYTCDFTNYSRCTKRPK